MRPLRFATDDTLALTRINYDTRTLLKEIYDP